MTLEKTLRSLASVDWKNALQGAGFFLVDFAERTAICSRLMLEWGYTPSDLIDGRWTDLLHPDDAGTCRNLWQRIIEGRESVFHAEYRIRNRRSGEWAWVQTHGTVLSWTDHGIGVYVGLDENIGPRKAAEVLVRQQLSEVEAVFQQAETLRVATRLAHSTFDLNRAIQLVLTQAHELLPFETATVCRFDGQEFQLLGMAGEGDLPNVSQRPENHPVRDALSQGGPGLCDDLDALGSHGPGGGYRSWLGTPLVVQGTVWGVVEFWHREPKFFHGDQVWPAMGLSETIAGAVARSQKDEALQEEAKTDPLTGLLTRRWLQRTGPGLLEEGSRDGQSLALLLLDIDHFKEVNDRHGHLAGDAVLMTIAQLCRHLLRQDDLFYRYGGEEFLVILPRTDAPTALQIAERLREVTSFAQFRPIEKSITVSIGLAIVAPGHRVSLEELIGEADQALYQAKGAGRDRVIASGRWTLPGS